MLTNKIGCRTVKSKCVYVQTNVSQHQDFTQRVRKNIKNVSLCSAVNSLSTDDLNNKYN